MAKSIFASKTFWLAVLQAIVGAVVVFHGVYPMIGWLVLAKSVLDVIVRYFTTVPIAV